MTDDLPEAVVRILSGKVPEPDRFIMEALVFHAYRRHHISRGRAKELLGLDYWTGETVLSENGFPYGWDYTVDMFREDLRSLEALPPRPDPSS